MRDHDPFPPKSILKRITSHNLLVFVEYKPSTVNPKVDVSKHPEAQEGLRASILDVLRGELDTRPNPRYDATTTVRATITVAVDTDNRVACYLFAVTMNVATLVETQDGPAEVIVWASDAHGLQDPLLVADAVRRAVREGLKSYMGHLATAKAGPFGVSRAVRCACGRDSWVGAEGADKTCEQCGAALVRPAV